MPRALVEDHSAYLTEANTISALPLPVSTARRAVAGEDTYFAALDQARPSYPHAEIPSQWDKSPNVVLSTVSDSLIELFASFVIARSGIDRLYWRLDRSGLKIWIPMECPDFELEKRIYEAYMQFLDRFPDVTCDLSVIYLLGKPVEQTSPYGAYLLVVR